MKKVIVLVLALGMVLTLIGCASRNVGGVQFFVAKDPIEDIGDVAVEDWSTNTWGLSLELRDVTATGMTLVCHQNGSGVSGELQTVAEFTVMTLDGEERGVLPTRGDYIPWDSEPYTIPSGGQLVQSLNWEDIYGELPAGEYVLMKEFMDFCGEEGSDVRTFLVNFTVE